MSTYEQTMLKLEQMTQATNAQQMAWQEKMSGQSHQLEVSDLIKAGLNPVLSSGGNGAQSYTTSLDSGANAIANTYSAHESAAATRYAARQAASATRAAANAQLRAATLAYAAQTYHTDKSYELGKYQADMSYKTAIDKPVNSLGGFFDKFATKAGLYDLLGSKTVKSGLSDIRALFNDPKKYFLNKVNDGQKITFKNFILSSAGVSQINSFLKKFGIARNNTTRKLAVQAFVFGSNNARDKLIGYIPRRNVNSAYTRSNLR